LGRWERLDLICIDELGYVPLAETACELMFQVIADRAEKAAVIVTINLPFSEWSQVIYSKSAAVQGVDRSADGSGTHHHNRVGLLPVPPHHGAAQGQQIMKGRVAKRR
jgi:DNA replication protein DnaC